MCRKLFYVMTFALVLALAGSASARLVGYYDFEGDYQDSSGYGNHGDPCGYTYLDTGPTGFGQALHLEGDGFVNLGNGVSSTFSFGGILDVQYPNTGATLMAWVYIEPGTESEQYIVGRDDFMKLSHRSYNDDPETEEVEPTYDTGFAQTKYMDDETGGGGWSQYGDGSLPGLNKVDPFDKLSVDITDGRTYSSWHHLAFTYDLAGGMETMYVDGVAVKSGLTTGPMWGYLNTSYRTPDRTLIPPTPMIIGARRLPGGDKWFSGLIDEVRIYDEALADWQVVQTMPEPATVMLLGLGSLALLRKKRA